MLGVSLLVFLFLHLVPGDPVDQLAGGEATVDQRKRIEDCMGLGLSMPRQFARFVGHVADGSLGDQCRNVPGDITVGARIAEVLPYTMELAFAGLLVALVLALPLGIIAAIARGSWIDTLASVTSLVGISLPMMLLAPLLLYWFFVEFGIAPGPSETGVAALVLPACAVGLQLMAMLSRMTRSSMIEVLGEDYVRTAKAKGLGRGAVLGRHALRNAITPVLTVAGLQFGALLSGSIIVEQVFARPGLGTLLLDGINERNYPVVQGCVLVIACIYVAVNIVVDMSYGLVDPRIRRA